MCEALRINTYMIMRCIIYIREWCVQFRWVGGVLYLKVCFCDLCREVVERLLAAACCCSW